MSAEATDAFLTRVKSIEDRAKPLYGNTAFGEVNSKLSTVEAQIHELPASIQQVRSRGYVFKNYLERKAEVLSQQWVDVKLRVATAMGDHSNQLRPQTYLLERRIQSLRSNRSEPELVGVDSAISDLQSRIEAATNSLEGMYRPLAENVHQTMDQVKEISWVLDQTDSATFRLYPSEGVVSAVKAQWLTSEDEGPKGILYLTDERLLFEQNEEIATKKTLFITTQKQKIQELKWEAALGEVESVKASERGGRILGIGKKELLEFEFAPGAPVHSMVLRLEADSDNWQALIGHARSGEIAGERTIQKEKAAIEAARSAPTKCTTCGARITQPVVKGMNEIKCEYCGALMRL